MKRPCHCDRCYLCCLYRDNPAYRALWGDESPAEEIPDMTDLDPQQRLVLAERLAESGQLRLPAVVRNVQKLLGDDWPAFAVKHGVGGEMAPPSTSGNFRKLPETSVRGPCVHLGVEVRRQGCPTCRGTVQVKVYSCSIYTECSLSKKLPDLACCAGCESYQPKPPEESSHPY